MNRYPQDLHAVLGISEKAGPDELRRAYLALAVKYHPDRNPGDLLAEERFKDVSQAYAILSDPQARARYERLRPKKPDHQARKGADAGPGAERPQAGGPAGGGSAKGGRPESRSGTDQSAFRSAEEQSAKERSAEDRAGGPGETESADFDEILAGFFKSAKGRDTLRDLEAEMAKAGFNFKASEFADWLKARRRPASDSPPPKSFWEKLGAKLPGAAARARKKAEQYEIHYQIALTPQAAASGTLVEISYPRGDSQPHRLKVRIPAGARDGSRLRLFGQGRRRPGPGPEEARGDLILTIAVVAQGDLAADLRKTRA